MHQLIGECPVCQKELTVTRLNCSHCHTAIEGHFSAGRIAQLNPEQMNFVELFIKCEGKLNRVGQELNQTYPSVRGKLDDVIKAMGFTPTPESDIDIDFEEKRKELLAQVAAGKISAAEAMKILKQQGGQYG